LYQQSSQTAVAIIRIDKQVFKVTDRSSRPGRVVKPDEASWEPQFTSYRKLAFDEHRRTVQVWSHGYVVVGSTEREAQDYLRWYAEEQADHPWADGWLSKFRAGVQELRP
jgi:dimethylsulfone monooxygenase